MAKGVAKDFLGTQIRTTSICYQTMQSRCLQNISLNLGLKSCVDLCLYYGRTSLNSPCSSLPPRFSSVNPPYTLAIPSKSLCAHTHKGKNKNKKIMHMFHCSPQFMAAGRHKMDTFLKAWSSIGILKKQLNKGSLKPTFRWNTCSYDKHTRYYNLYASWPALMNR